MDSWIFIYIWVIIQCCFIYLVHIIPALAIGYSFSWLLCPFDVAPLLHSRFLFVLFCFWYILTFWHYSYSGLTLYISCPGPRISHFSKESGSYYCRVVLGTKVSVGDVLVATGATPPFLKNVI